MSESQLLYQDATTINKRVRGHSNNQAGAAERIDEYFRHADEFITTGFEVFTVSIATPSIDADGQNLFTIFNASATVRVRIIDMVPCYGNKGTIDNRWEYRRLITTAPTGGTLEEIVRLDGGSAEPDAGITCRSTNPTVTLAAVGDRLVSSVIQDFSIQPLGSLVQQLSLANMLRGRSLVLRQDQGVVFHVVTSPATGLFSLTAVFQQFTP